MHVIGFALVLAAAGATLSISEDTAFARAAGNGAAAGAAGAASGGASGGGGGGANVIAVFDRNVPPRDPVVRYVPPRPHDACFKQERLYDAYGYAVVDLHGGDCFE